MPGKLIPRKGVGFPFRQRKRLKRFRVQETLFIVRHVPEAMVEKVRALVLGVNQEGRMGSLTAACFI